MKETLRDGSESESHVFFLVMPDLPQHYTPLEGIGKREGQTSDLGIKKWTDGSVDGTHG